MRLLIENWPWKLLSLLLAFLLWAGYVAESELATSVSVPLQFRNIPEDLEITSDVPDRIYIKVRGPNTKLNAASLSQSAITLNLNEIHRGEQTIALNDTNVGLPPGLKLQRVVPSQIRLTVERRATREIPVAPKIAHGPPEGYRIESQTVTPDKVRIVGPESRVNAMNTAETDGIDLSNTVSSRDFKTPVYISDPHIHLERENPVTVRINLEKSR